MEEHGDIQDYRLTETEAMVKRQIERVEKILEEQMAKTAALVERQLERARSFLQQNQEQEARTRTTENSVVVTDYERDKSNEKAMDADNNNALFANVYPEETDRKEQEKDSTKDYELDKALDHCNKDVVCATVSSEEPHRNESGLKTQSKTIEPWNAVGISSGRIEWVCKKCKSATQGAMKHKLVVKEFTVTCEKTSGLQPDSGVRSGEASRNTVNQNTNTPPSGTTEMDESVTHVQSVVPVQKDIVSAANYPSSIPNHHVKADTSTRLEKTESMVRGHVSTPQEKTTPRTLMHDTDSKEIALNCAGNTKTVDTDSTEEDSGERFKRKKSKVRGISQAKPNKTPRKTESESHCKARSNKTKRVSKHTQTALSIKDIFTEDSSSADSITHLPPKSSTLDVEEIPPSESLTNEPSMYDDEPINNSCMLEDKITLNTGTKGLPAKGHPVVDYDIGSSPSLEQRKNKETKDSTLASDTTREDAKIQEMEYLYDTKMKIKQSQEHDRDSVCSGRTDAALPEVTLSLDSDVLTVVFIESTQREISAHQLTHTTDLRNDSTSSDSKSSIRSNQLEVTHPGNNNDPSDDSSRNQIQGSSPPYSISTDSLQVSEPRVAHTPADRLVTDVKHSQISATQELENGEETCSAESPMQSLRQSNTTDSPKTPGNLSTTNERVRNLPLDDESIDTSEVRNACESKHPTTVKEIIVETTIVPETAPLLYNNDENNMRSGDSEVTSKITKDTRCDEEVHEPEIVTEHIHLLYEKEEGSEKSTTANPTNEELRLTKTTDKDNSGKTESYKTSSKITQDTQFVEENHEPEIIPYDVQLLRQDEKSEKSSITYPEIEEKGKISSQIDQDDFSNSKCSKRATGITRDTQSDEEIHEPQIIPEHFQLLHEERQNSDKTTTTNQEDEKTEKTSADFVSKGRSTIAITTRHVTEFDVEVRESKIITQYTEDENNEISTMSNQESVDAASIAPSRDSHLVERKQEHEIVPEKASLLSINGENNVEPAAASEDQESWLTEIGNMESIDEDIIIPQRSKLLDVDTDRKGKEQPAMESSLHSAAKEREKGAPVKESGRPEEIAMREMVSKVQSRSPNNVCTQNRDFVASSNLNEKVEPNHSINTCDEEIDCEAVRSRKRAYQDLEESEVLLNQENVIMNGQKEFSRTRRETTEDTVASQSGNIHERDHDAGTVSCNDNISSHSTFSGVSTQDKNKSVPEDDVDQIEQECSLTKNDSQLPPTESLSTNGTTRVADNESTFVVENIDSYARKITDIMTEVVRGGDDGKDRKFKTLSESPQELVSDIFFKNKGPQEDVLKQTFQSVTQTEDTLAGALVAVQDTEVLKEKEHTMLDGQYSVDHSCQSSNGERVRSEDSGHTADPDISTEKIIDTDEQVNYYEELKDDSEENESEEVDSSFFEREREIYVLSSSSPTSEYVFEETDVSSIQYQTTSASTCTESNEKAKSEKKRMTKSKKLQTDKSSSDRSKAYSFCESDISIGNEDLSTSILQFSSMGHTSEGGTTEDIVLGTRSKKSSSYSDFARQNDSNIKQDKHGQSNNSSKSVYAKESKEKRHKGRIRKPQNKENTCGTDEEVKRKDQSLVYKEGILLKDTSKFSSKAEDKRTSYSREDQLRNTKDIVSSFESSSPSVRSDFYDDIDGSCECTTTEDIASNILQDTAEDATDVEETFLREELRFVDSSEKTDLMGTSSETVTQIENPNFKK